MTTKIRNGKGRQERGQIELLAAMLVVGTMAVIGYVFFLVDTGVSAFYKQRLQFLTAQGATFAAGYKGSDPQAATQIFLRDLCTKMGLQTSQLDVTISDTVVNGQASYACQATATMPLLAGSIFPATVTLTGSSTAPKPGGTPQIIVLAILGIGNRFAAPNMTVTGNMLGIGNSVSSAKSNPAGTGGSGQGTNAGIGNVGSGNNLGIGNVGAGSGTNGGIGNVNTGSGNNLGIGNVNTGSGNNLGIGNVNTGSGNSLGIGNVWN